MIVLFVLAVGNLEQVVKAHLANSRHQLSVM